ncbi:hypothetical protein [Salinilacihabitans rarus]|uniref:hypothetical protein n=1 Tax=Salinilacihabitans rarus TaxID=2961596 RepID=UPI0020C90565|nr:hypothetical protein [Salinilacihabitans rarus]
MAATIQTDVDLDERDRRALEQYLTVLEDYGPAKGAEDLYVVVSQSGKEYLVDARTGACECPDAEYRRPTGGCKHVRRVQFATGRRPIPAGVDVDPQLSAHVSEGEPRFVATDGGRVTKVPLDSFDELAYGDRIVYVGPDDLPGGWAAPRDRDQPYRFLHVCVGGTLTCETRFKSRRYLAPEHPANDPRHWRRATEDEIKRGL